MNSYIILGANSDMAFNLINKLSLNNKIYAIARKFDVYNYEDNKNVEMIFSEIDQFSATDALFSEIASRDDNILGIANFAGTIYIKSIPLVTESDYDRVLNSNFKTSFAITRSVAKYFSNASILFISTTATLVGLANHELVTASKSAVNGLVISAAASYANKNLRFNAIAPSLVETKLATPFITNDAGRKFSEGINPLSRIGTIDDITNMAMFLLSPENSWITGQIFAVDGGMSNLKNKLKA
jgi:3-oxoacyl-[acyl-carrier protein] reductase